MFNVGGGEILVIAFIALIVLGPQRLPGAARQVGKAMGDLRRISSGFQSELKSALDDSPPTSAPARQREALATGGGAAAGSGADPVGSAIGAVSSQAAPLAKPDPALPSALDAAEPTTPDVAAEASPRPAASKGRRRAPLRAAPAQGTDGSTEPGSQRRPSAR